MLKKNGFAVSSSSVWFAALALSVCVAAVAAVAATAQAAPVPYESPYFKADRDGNSVLLKSPYGEKMFFGPVDFHTATDFEIAIPISALKKKEGSGAADKPDINMLQSDVDELLYKANQSYLKGDVAKAVEAIDAILVRSPDNVRALMMKGSLMHVQGEKDLARKSWRKALDIDPSNRELAKVLDTLPQDTAANAAPPAGADTAAAEDSLPAPNAE